MAGIWNVPNADSVRELAFRRIDHIILGEIERARPRLEDLKKNNPDAGRSRLAELAIDRKKAFAGTGGLVSGVFGLAAIPLDMVMVTYLQISVAVDIAMLNDINLKSRSAQQELLDVIARGNGLGPVYRSGTPILARFAFSIMRRRGLPGIGRFFPLVAMPVCAWMNNRDVEKVGLAVKSHYEGLEKLALRRRKTC